MNHIAHLNSTSSCPLCDSLGNLYCQVEAFAFDQKFEVHQCKRCSICYTHPRPSYELLSEIYTADYWQRTNKSNASKVMTSLTRSLNRCRLAMMVRPLIRHLNPGDRILEVGCGSGILAAYLQECGYQVEVTDFSPEIVAEVSRQYGIRGYCGDLQDIPLLSQRRYHAVVFNHVLEHLHAPGENLLIARRLLEPNGLVFVEVPNIDSLQFRLFRNRWFPLQLPEHLFHFSPHTFQTIAHKSGLEQVWLSTFSPRVSTAGYVASLFPRLQPKFLRRSMSKLLLLAYLVLQLIFLPVAYIEALWGKGGAIRALYRVRNSY